MRLSVMDRLSALLTAAAIVLAAVALVLVTRTPHPAHHRTSVPRIGAQLHRPPSPAVQVSSVPCRLLTGDELHECR